MVQEYVLNTEMSFNTSLFCCLEVYFILMILYVQVWDEICSQHTLQIFECFVPQRDIAQSEHLKRLLFLNMVVANTWLNETTQSHRGEH